MHFSAEQLDIGSRIDAKAQWLIDEGADDIAIFVGMSHAMPAFKRLLDNLAAAWFERGQLVLQL